jgi:hypothetical protein
MAIWYIVARTIWHPLSEIGLGADLFFKIVFDAIGRVSMSGSGSI